MLTEAKRPRFGLWGIGVPSSSKRSGEVRLWVEWVGDCRCEEERGGVLGGGGELVVECGRGRKKLGREVGLDGGEVFERQGWGAVVLLQVSRAFRLETEGLPIEMSSVYLSLVGVFFRVGSGEEGESGAISGGGSVLFLLVGVLPWRALWALYRSRRGENHV